MPIGSVVGVLAAVLLGVAPALHSGAAAAPARTTGVSVVSLAPDSSVHVVRVEIRNDFAVPVQDVFVVATAVDTSGAVIERSDPAPCLPLVIDPAQPGGCAVGLHHTELDIRVSVSSYLPTTHASNTNLSVLQATVVPTSNGLQRVSGTVRNDNATPVSLVGVMALFHGAGGELVWATGALANGGAAIAPGQTVPWEVEDAIPTFATVQYIAFPEDRTPPTSATTLAGPSRAVAAGSRVDLHGVARAGDRVTFEQFVSSGWVEMPGSTVVANGRGEFSAKIAVRGPIYVRAIAPGAASFGVAIVVRAAPTLTVRRGTVARGSSVTLAGTVRGAPPGTTVTIERKVGRRWRPIARTPLSGASRFSYRWTPTVRGTYVLRASVPRTGLVLGSESASRVLVVR